MSSIACRCQDITQLTGDEAAHYAYNHLDQIDVDDHHTPARRGRLQGGAIASSELDRTVSCRQHDAELIV